MAIRFFVIVLQDTYLYHVPQNGLQNKRSLYFFFCLQVWIDFQMLLLFRNSRTNFYIKYSGSVKWRGTNFASFHTQASSRSRPLSNGVVVIWWWSRLWWEEGFFTRFDDFPIWLTLKIQQAYSTWQCLSHLLLYFLCINMQFSLLIGMFVINHSTCGLFTWCDIGATRIPSKSKPPQN